MLATGSSSDSVAALLAGVVFGSQFVVTWLTELPVGFEDAFPMAVALEEPVWVLVLEGERAVRSCSLYLHDTSQQNYYYHKIWHGRQKLKDI